MALALSPLGPNFEHLHFLELTLLYKKVRSFTLSLCSNLEVEDAQVQSMAVVSPPKWHLAHTTWFFEDSVLMRHMKGYRPFHAKFGFLFNAQSTDSGAQVPAHQRGLLSRPTLREVYQYREWVDSHVFQFLSSEHSGQIWDELWKTITLGIHHEQQHQELLIADIKHILWSNPLRPAYHPDSSNFAVTDANRFLEKGEDRVIPSHESFVEGPSGVESVGARGGGFAFDNEKPDHRVFVEPFQISSSPVTQGEYLEFIEARSYEDRRLWLSDGWDVVCREGWEAPLYWEKDGSKWQVFTLAGMQPLQENEPVCHISFYEAEAYARWRGFRLPTENEWEVTAHEHASGLRGLSQGNFAESGRLQPMGLKTLDRGRRAVHQMLGDAWEWTLSSYLPYPGYSASSGEFSETNLTFASQKMVLKGGSCASPKDHIRISYRNFLPPASRWQFSGLRLAG